MRSERVDQNLAREHFPTFCSPVRWAGSKRRLLPLLRRLWNEGDERYIEAFAGSACLFFELQPGRAVLNDTNKELIDAYRVLAKHPVLLHHHLSELPSEKDFYYRLRGESPVDSFEAALRFFYLNRNCFNGIYRTNKSGQFNVPYASSRAGTVPPLRKWLSAAKLLSNATLCSGDFDHVVRSHVRGGDFVYLDPPYAVSNRRVFTQYSPNEFGLEDLERLRSLMNHIDSKGATFVVSYALSRETGMLSEGWCSVRTLAQRNVAGFAHHRRKAVEVVISNDPARIAKVRKNGQ